jgi:translation elongation factor P/translation initiation factor 5A
MKVIASQLRKGNVVEVNDALYVILKAENFHPGKGTPVTQVDMRRISNGVKVSERWKTTDGVERAHVEEKTYTSSSTRTARATTSWSPKPTSRSRPPRMSWATRRSGCRTA